MNVVVSINQLGLQEPVGGKGITTPSGTAGRNKNSGQALLELQRAAASTHPSPAVPEQESPDCPGDGGGLAQPCSERGC